MVVCSMGGVSSSGYFSVIGVLVVDLISFSSSTGAFTVSPPHAVEEINPINKSKVNTPDKRDFI